MTDGADTIGSQGGTVANDEFTITLAQGTTGTGNNFGPHSNVAQHLVDCLNVVCGRYLREGDRTLVEMLSPERPIYPEVIPASRTWEKLPPGRSGGQANVVILTRERSVMNPLGRLWIWMIAKMSYLR